MLCFACGVIGVICVCGVRGGDPGPGAENDDDGERSEPREVLENEPEVGVGVALDGMEGTGTGTAALSPPAVMPLALGSWSGRTAGAGRPNAADGGWGVDAELTFDVECEEAEENVRGRGKAYVPTPLPAVVVIIVVVAVLAAGEAVDFEVL